MNIAVFLLIVTAAQQINEGRPTSYITNFLLAGSGTIAIPKKIIH
jgi:hypothetical protein